MAHNIMTITNVLWRTVGNGTFTQKLYYEGYINNSNNDDNNNHNNSRIRK